MAMGRRKNRTRTPGLWIAANELPRTGGHPFYLRLNQVLDAHAFDEFVEAQCAPFYAEPVGRPSLTPGTYFRLLLVGYFEGIDSERGIAWRTADSLALRGFLGLGLDETPPEHSTISRTRRLIDVETHRTVFTWILQVLATADLISGKTIGIDATTLEANAALRSIVRRDSGETYQEFLTRLAQASGIATPTRADLARLDRTRPQKGRNTDWRHPHDPDARITKMKDGRTHLAHKAAHAVDLETGAIDAGWRCHRDARPGSGAHRHRPRAGRAASALAQRPRAASLSGTLATYLATHGMAPTRGAPSRPMTHGKIERYHRSLKNIVKLEQSYSPWELERALTCFVEDYNHRRLPESLATVTPPPSTTGGDWPSWPGGNGSSSGRCSSDDRRI